MAEYIEILMPLLNEGVDTWRPVQAEKLPGGRYRILGPIPDEEEWAFAPGAIVSAVERTFSDGQRTLVAEWPK